jgi:hypothetical protein
MSAAETTIGGFMGPQADNSSSETSRTERCRIDDRVLALS